MIRQTTYIYGMEPLNIQWRAIRGIPLEAVAVKGVGTMVPGVWVHRDHWFGRRWLLGRWSGASVGRPRIDGIDGGCEIRLFRLLVGGASSASWRHRSFAVTRRPPGRERRRGREQGSGASARRKGQGSWSADCWQRVESLTGTRTQASPAQTQPYRGNKRQRC